MYNRKQPDTFVQGKMNSRCWEYDTSYYKVKAEYEEIDRTDTSFAIFSNFTIFRKIENDSEWVKKPDFVNKMGGGNTEVKIEYFVVPRIAGKMAMRLYGVRDPIENKR